MFKENDEYSKELSKFKKDFIAKNNIEDFFSKACQNDPNLTDNLYKIKENYKEYSQFCSSIAQRILLKILDENTGIADIHSARFRVKDSNSMLVKIVKKKANLPKKISDKYDIEKYRNLNVTNYKSILTDLIGVRILIRYREQWALVHNWIWNNFFQGEDKYIINNESKSEMGSTHIAEKPKLYYRHQDDLRYLKKLDPNSEIFEYIFSDEGYNSIHYIIYIDNKYAEIQVRTIFDEAWSECTHDLVYKCPNKKMKLELNELSKCLAKQTLAAEAITNIMYEKIHRTDLENVDKPSKDIEDIQLANSEKNNNNNLENRIKLLENEDIQSITCFNDLI